MLARSRAMVVGVVTGALVLTGCADGDVDLEDADLLEETEVDDIERGVVLLDEEDPDEVIYAAEVVDQCLADASEERPDATSQMRVDLAGEGSLVVTYDPDTDQLVGVDLVTEPDAPTIAWEASGAAAWEFRDDALLGEATVDGVDDDGAPDHVLRFAIDWHDGVVECVDTEEPVTELAGEASYLELPGARLDAVEVCEADGGWTMILEDGSVLTVTGTGDSASLDLVGADGATREVQLVATDDLADDDGDVEGTFTVGDAGTDQVAEAVFRIDLDAAANCESR